MNMEVVSASSGKDGTTRAGMGISDNGGNVIVIDKDGTVTGRIGAESEATEDEPASD